MTKLEEYMTMPSIGYWSGMGGLELKNIEYGIEDYAFFISGMWCSDRKRQLFRVKIHYDNEVPYCKIRGYKIPFDEIIRMG